MAKYLDGIGLGVLWGKILSKFYTKEETDNKYPLKTALNDYYNKSNSDGRYAQKTDLDSYYNKTNSDNRYALKTALDDYYLKTETYSKGEVDNLIDGVSGGEIDAYTKTESDSRYYQKSESDAKYQVKGSYASTTSIYSNQNIGFPQVLPSINVREIKVFSLKNSKSSETESEVKLPSGGYYLAVIGDGTSTVGHNVTIFYLPGGSKISNIRGTYGACGFYIRLS